MIQFRLLGPVRAMRVEQDLPVSGSKAHTVIAALLLAQGRVVSDERLSRVLWGDQPPSTMNAQIHTHVSRLRKVLEPDVRIARRAPGYALDLGDSQVDTHEYQRRDRAGRAALAAAQWAQADSHFSAAIDLFEGPVLGNTTESFIGLEATHWEEQRMETILNGFEAKLALGHHHELVPDLAHAVRQRPLCERVRSQYMTALYRCGRQGDALQAFHDVRKRLASELGVDPSPDLAQTYQAVLQNTIAPVVAVSAAPMHNAPSPDERSLVNEARQHSLPLGASAFVGRESELHDLGRVLGVGGYLGIAAPRRCVVSGLPGVGKTSLLVRAAYQHRAGFADGHLYANLNTAEGKIRDTREVLVDLLSSLGCSPPEAEAELGRLTATYRALTVTRQVLVVLDNVSTAEQVSALLPAGDESACLIIGSAGLAAAAGASVLTLEPLSPEESAQLLSAIIGPARVAAEPSAAARVVEQCAGLPLALRAVAGRLVARPGWSLQRCADTLEPPDTRIAQLSAEDLSVLSALQARWSSVSAKDANDIRLLARLSGSDLNTYTMARTLNCDLEAAEERLAVLAGHALIETVPSSPSDADGHAGVAQGPEVNGRSCYRINPLLRLFAIFHAGDIDVANPLVRDASAATQPLRGHLTGPPAPSPPVIASGNSADDASPTVCAVA